MKPNNRGIPRSLCANNSQPGFILIVVVILTGAILSVILIQTTLSSLTLLEQSQKGWEGARAELHTEGCTEEALIRLRRDENYSGGTLPLGSGTCTLIITGSGNTRTMNVSGALGNYTQSLSIDVTLSPFAITRWE